MNTPGMSIFQGAESLQVNKSLDRAAEEEDLEDQRRRHEELGNLLQNAFADLDEDETTIDSTANFQDAQPNHINKGRQAMDNHESHIIQNGNNGYSAGNENGHSHGHYEHSNCEVEIHRLKMIIESRSHELEHAQKLLNDEYKKHDEMTKRLTIMEAELDRALAAKKNTHELLVESKEKCSNMENTINKMKAERKALEMENNTLLGKLETAQTLLADVQRKYDMVERDLNKNSERNYNAKCKQMEERHRAELEILQQRIEQLADKLDKKTSDLEQMQARYEALQRSHDSMLCDKASKINDLNHALNEAQKRCEELLSRPDCVQENVRLQKLVITLQDEINGMEKTINTLKANLDQTTAELDIMDSVLHQYNVECSPHKFGSSSSGNTHGRIVGSTPLTTIDRLGNLKDELYRALSNVKSKRDELRRLHKTLDEKQQEIINLRQEENKHLVQITTLKEENVRLENRLKILKEEHHKNLVKCSTDSNQRENLKKELDNIREQKELLEQERNSLEGKLKDFEIDMEELRQEHSTLKLNYEQIVKENTALKQNQPSDELQVELEKLKFLLKDSQAECDRLKSLYVEISNAKDILKYDMEKLLKSDHLVELQMEKEKVANIQKALHLTEMKNSELAKILETEKLCHEREVNNLKEKLERLRIESDDQKAQKESTNECMKCLDYVTELTKFEIQILKLNNNNAMAKKEIGDLQEELKISKTHIAELNKQLIVSEQQEKLIKELKLKAAQFEEYIKKTHTNSSSSELSIIAKSPIKKSVLQLQLHDKSIMTSPQLEKFEIRKAEARVRDEMAKIFAGELKKIQTKLQESNEKNYAMQRDHQLVTANLMQREKEVELLKEAILAEREKMEEILRNKDQRCKEVIDKQNALLQKLREELEKKTQQVKQATKELEERQKQIEAERKSMKAVMKQWEEQRKSVDDVEKEWKEKFTQLQNAQASVLEDWKNKYLSAKQTALNYKRYSDDKEAHMLKEYDRLKYEYNLKLTKFLSKEHRQTNHQQKVAADSTEGDGHLRILQSTNDDNKENNSEQNLVKL